MSLAGVFLSCPLHSLSWRNMSKFFCLRQSLINIGFPIFIFQWSVHPQIARRQSINLLLKRKNFKNPVQWVWIFEGQETTVRTWHGTMDWFRIGKGVWQGCSSNSSSNLYAECVLSCFTCVQLLVTPWTVAHQAPPSMGFSRQEYWSGVPCPPPGDPPDPGIKPGSPAAPARSGVPCPPPGDPPDPGIEPGSPVAPARQAGSSLLKHWQSPICRVHYGKRLWIMEVHYGWVRNWNQDCLEKYQQPQICRWYHANGRKWKELKSLLIRVKEESEKADLKLNIQKTKIMASSPIPSVTDFIFLGSKSLWMVTTALKLEDTCSLEGKLWQT